jgi:multidrug efflux pump subunit AcrB
MWIVKYALGHRHSIGVLAMLLLLLGGLGARNMSTDVLPPVNIPAINVIWTYQGLNAQEMVTKLTSFSELAIMNNVDNLASVRSETLNGVAIVRVTFQPGTNVTDAFAQVTSVSQTILRRMPAGTSPPLIVPYVPSSVPIIQLVMASNTLTDAALHDYARLQLRAQIQSIPGIRLTLPYGGAARQVMIDLKPEALQAYGISPSDVARATAAQNLTLPSGALRIDSREITIFTNASPETIASFSDLPLRSVDGRVIRVSDVAAVRDGQAVQSNIARLDGQNAVVVSILKLGNASTLSIIRQIKERLPELQAAAPEGITIAPVFDQSVFVAQAINNVLVEALIVALLVAFVVLVFLGSWRSSLIVLTSIPLALLASIAGLSLTGNTFNLMTLGGLMLAIGILVDNALVEIENINRNLEKGLPLRQAIVTSAREVVFPEFVSTMSICIVFSPLFMLTGIAAFVFVPLALAVVFAMIASFILSRTLVPTLASLMLSAHSGHEAPHGPLGWFSRGVDKFLSFLERTVEGIVRVLLAWKILPMAGLAAALGLGAVSAANVGREFFPETDAGMIRVYVRAETGLRLDETAQRFAEVQREIRRVIPEDEVGFIVESIGSPEPINLAWVESGVIGSFDGEILVQLAASHGPTAGYISAIRARLAERFPTMSVYFRPADATAQTLAAGTQTAVEVRLIGRDGQGNAEIARNLIQTIKAIPGAVDVTQRQVRDLKSYFLEIDRVRALQLGVTPQEAATAILSVLGASGTVAPSFWSDPQQGISYTVQVIAPPPNLTSLDQILNTPIRTTADGRQITLRSFATLQLRDIPANIDRTTLQPTTTILANVEGADLGSVYGKVVEAVDAARPSLKPGNRIEIAGQARAMEQAYGEMLSGLLMAAVFVYLVMVVNFQSWLMPMIAMGGLPIAISGAMVALNLTGTPVSVPALTGLIMVIGVSTANSVLVTSFARDKLLEGVAPRQAALDAVKTRLRPVLMTATAMIVGILPMALGAGEGGEQNAPLGRAVIGGLIFGTGATLSFVPFLFATLIAYRDRNKTTTASPAAPVEADTLQTAMR